MKLTDYSRDARAYSRFSEYMALAWVASWGWSSGVCIDAAGTLSGKSRGLAPRLVDLGYLKPHPWEKSNHIKLYYTITKSGIERAHELHNFARDFSKKHAYPFSTLPDKIPSFKSHSAVHDLYCQILCVMAIIANAPQFERAQYYYATPDLYGNYAVGEKVPDFLIESDHYLDFFEFENSRKSKPELLNFVDYYYRKAVSKDGYKRIRVFVYSINSAIQKQFTSIWKPGNLVSKFVRNEYGQWVQASELGTRIEDAPEKRGVRFSYLNYGMEELLRELKTMGKREAAAEPIDLGDEYV